MRFTTSHKRYLSPNILIQVVQIGVVRCPFFVFLTMTKLIWSYGLVLSLVDRPNGVHWTKYDSVVWLLSLKFLARNLLPLYLHIVHKNEALWYLCSCEPTNPQLMQDDTALDLIILLLILLRWDTIKTIMLKIQKWNAEKIVTWKTQILLGPH